MALYDKLTGHLNFG